MRDFLKVWCSDLWRSDRAATTVNHSGIRELSLDCSRPKRLISDSVGSGHHIKTRASRQEAGLSQYYDVGSPSEPHRFSISQCGVRYESSGLAVLLGSITVSLALSRLLDGPYSRTKKVAPRFTIPEPLQEVVGPNTMQPWRIREYSRFVGGCYQQRYSD